MPVHDNLGIRMKENYENVSKTRLVRRMPVAIRIDGKAFHTFTKGFQKPFDKFLIKAMQDTTLYLCKNIQGCVFGYTQSDEITLILVDYNNLETCAWFDYEVQKLCSISASMATMIFNKTWYEQIKETEELQEKIELGTNSMKDITTFYDQYCIEDFEDGWEEFFNHMPAYKKVAGTAMFDARCFNIPKEEVTNLIYWRQLDAERNSVQMVGQTCFSHKELHGLSCKAIKEKLFTERNIDWDGLKPYLKRGSAVCKLNINGNSEWVLREDFPMLKGEARRLVDNLVYVGEE